MLSSFNTYVVILDQNKEEHVIDVHVSYSAHYDPGRTYGPPELCYPEESELEIYELTPTEPLPKSITIDDLYNLSEREKDRLEMEAWHDYLTGDE